MLRAAMVPDIFGPLAGVHAVDEFLEAFGARLRALEATGYPVIPGELDAAVLLALPAAIEEDFGPGKTVRSVVKERSETGVLILNAYSGVKASLQVIHVGEGLGRTLRRNELIIGLSAGIPAIVLYVVIISARCEAERNDQATA